MFICGMPEPPVEDPIVYDFNSSDYWNAVDDAWEREKASKEEGKFCWIHLGWCYHS